MKRSPMKRTPMNRGTSTLKRTPLARGTSTLKRSVMPRTSPWDPNGVREALSMTTLELRALRTGKPVGLARGTSQLKRTPLDRGTSSLKRGKALPAVNKERSAKRLKAYQARLQRADWQVLRRQVFERDRGLCQCPPCIDYRAAGGSFLDTEIPIWFDTKGGIHGFDVHHTTYARFGRELLEDVLTMHPLHHRKVEAKYGYRQKWLGAR